MTMTKSFYTDWLLSKLRGDEIVLRMNASTQQYKQRANIARGEAFAYYSDAEMPMACHILYRAWVQPDGKNYLYDLIQTPFPHATAEWENTIMEIIKNWSSAWLADESNVFTLQTPFNQMVVKSHPTVLTHLARMHGMLVYRPSDPFAAVLRDIAAKRLDAVIRNGGRDWASALGM